VKFKAAADKNERHICWMVAACYIKSIGTPENLDQAIQYSRKAMNAGILEETYWFGICFGDHHEYLFFKKDYQKGNL
jgi:TPR repeat protein